MMPLVSDRRQAFPNLRELPEGVAHAAEIVGAAHAVIGMDMLQLLDPSAVSDYTNPLDLGVHLRAFQARGGQGPQCR